MTNTLPKNRGRVHVTTSLFCLCLAWCESVYSSLSKLLLSISLLLGFGSYPCFWAISYEMSSLTTPKAYVGSYTTLPLMRMVTFRPKHVVEWGRYVLHKINSLITSILPSFPRGLVTVHWECCSFPWTCHCYNIFLNIILSQRSLVNQFHKIPNFETYNPVKNSLVETLFELSHSILLICYQIRSKAS